MLNDNGVIIPDGLVDSFLSFHNSSAKSVVRSMAHTVCHKNDEKPRLLQTTHAKRFEKRFFSGSRPFRIEHFSLWNNCYVGFLELAF